MAVTEAGGATAGGATADGATADGAMGGRGRSLPDAGWRETGLTPRQIQLTLGGVMLAMFLASLDQTIVGTALPRIIGDLGGFDRFTWVSTAYIVASTTTVLLAGSFGDVYGRKWIYIVGLAVFLGGSVLAGSAQSMNTLIAFRAIQGLGGGVMMAMAFITIGDLFPPADRGKYQGMIAGVFGVSSVIGPTLGGFLTDNLSWHWIFYVNVPVGLLVIALFMRLFPDRKPERRREIDYPGAVLLVAAIVPGLIGLSTGDVQYAWSSPQVVGTLSLSAVSTIALVVTELRAPDPLLPLHIFADRIVAVSLLATFLTGFAMFGAIVFVPLLFQGVLGASATASGSFLTPMMLGVVFGSVGSGQLLSRAGGHYRLQGFIGLGIMAAGIAVLTQVSGDVTYGVALSGIVIMGFGLGSSFPLFTIAVQNAVSFQYLGVATAATQFFRSIGGSLGLALLGAFMVSRFRGGLGSSLPDGAAAMLPPEQLHQIAKSPNALLDPAALEGLRTQLAAAPGGSVAFASGVVDGLRSALAAAIGDVFTVSLVVVLVATASLVFLREIPLQTRGPQARARPVPAGETAPQPGGGSED